MALCKEDGGDLIIGLDRINRGKDGDSAYCVTGEPFITIGAIDPHMNEAIKAYSEVIIANVFHSLGVPMGGWKIYWRRSPEISKSAIISIPDGKESLAEYKITARFALSDKPEEIVAETKTEESAWAK